MRTSLIAVATLLLGLSSAACADAPITAADLQSDGQLREGSQQSVLAASAANRPAVQQAEQLQVTGVVAAESEGPLEDATRFSVDSEAIHLHLRAEDLQSPRPVTFVWTHGDQRRETMGFLHPAETLSHAASLPLALPLERLADPDAQAEREADFDRLEHAGDWKVEVYSAESAGRSLVFERAFEILDADAYVVAMQADLPTGE